jgi:hypothetical protein
MPGTFVSFHFVVSRSKATVPNTEHSHILLCVRRLYRILRMLADMGPKRPLSKVGIIFGDGIFAGEGLLDILGIKSTCKICQDTFHLLSETDGAWPKFFGSRAWPRLKEDFNNLVYSRTEAIYNDRHRALKERLAKENVPTWIEYLEKNVHGHRRQFVRCYVTTYRFNLGREGSSCAEANHSSYVRRIGESSIEEPAVMVKNCMNRHGDMCKERHQEMVNYRAHSIGTANRGTLGVEDTKALLFLSRWGYELWTWAKNEATNYHLLIDENGDVIVRRNGKTKGGRVIRKDDIIPCTCEVRIAFQGQCCHLVAANDGKFLSSLWHSRWHQREGLGKAGEEMNENDIIISTSSDKENDEDNEDVDGADEEEEATEQREIDDDDVSRQEVPAETSYSYRDVLAICQGIASHISKRSDAATHVGILLQFEEALRDGRVDGTRSFEQTFRTHVSAFTRNAGNSVSFMHSQNEAGEPVLPSQPPLTARGIPRDENSGRLPTKRLKTAKAMHMMKRGTKRNRGTCPSTSGPMALLNSTPKDSVCSFCKLRGHRKGSASCEAFTKLKATFVDYKEISMWSCCLGSPSTHAVEIPSTALTIIFAEVDWLADIPKEVVHVVLLQCYHSKYATQRMTSTHEDTPNPNLLSVDDNIVKVVLLAEGACRVRKRRAPAFYWYQK